MEVVHRWLGIDEGYRAAKATRAVCGQAQIDKKAAPVTEAVVQQEVEQLRSESDEQGYPLALVALTSAAPDL